MDACRRGGGLLGGTRVGALLVALVAAPVLVGCAPGATEGSGVAVTSPAFAEGETIPIEYTCGGDGAFPEVSWTGDAESWAVVVDDPDAPGSTFVHLVVTDLPVATMSLDDPETADGTAVLNGAGATGWTPPCPPSGEHRYRFTVHALSAPTGLDAGATSDEAIAAIDDLTVAEGTLTGLVAAP